ncbi:hypothetical protein F9U92_07185 [Shigella flexneri]|nr:hypothetical protein [Shigella flexneri]EFW4598426.1 hypothetical protein [Shigella flexneri]EGA1578573.1 hypothetical protein [Shigella flexneri]
MSIVHSLRFVQILLFIYTVSFYNITVRNVLCQQAQRFSLRYRVHNSWQQAAERYVSWQCS